MRRQFPLLVLISTIAALIGLGAWSLITIPVVLERAEAMAEREPYCIMRADVFANYRTAETRLDLSGWRMWASSDDWGHPSTYHGLLVVGPARRLFNWSHRHWAFQPLPDKSDTVLIPEPLCEPRPAFADTLPWLPRP